MPDHETLFDLKYRQGVSTWKLIKRFPEDKKRIHEVALLGVPEGTLRKTVRDKKLLTRLLKMKRKFSAKRRGSGRPAPGRSWLERLKKSLFPWL